MKPTPLLDFWQKPQDAGEPVAMLATTFALEPDFFEQNCLARFLEVSSASEGSGSIDDIVASVELHERLSNARVTVLADRSAPVQRTSLLWDLLSCQVEGGGLLHAKVAVLIWEKATRVILGSANLTAAGYRRQIELGLAVDLGDGCLFPPEVLTAIAKELESYLQLVPGYDADAGVFKRAGSTLALFNERISAPAKRSTMRVAFAPTNASAEPLKKLDAVWSGPQPLHAIHLSPFWDSEDQTVLTATRKLLTGRPADERYQHVAIVLGPRGQTNFSKHLAEIVDKVRQLKELDQEIRTLHAKCLLIESHEWVAALVGSSNHTKAGLGLTHRPRHREMNVWLAAPRNSQEGKSLLELIQLDKEVPANTVEGDSIDEDETRLPALPACFGLCQLIRSDDSAWKLHLHISATNNMPGDWEIVIAAGDRPFLTRTTWTEKGKPSVFEHPLLEQTLPMYIVVRYGDHVTPWAVVADDRHGLPPSPALASLRAQHLLDALANGRSLAQALREELERQTAEQDAKPGINLDPLKRIEVEGSLLRKGRALAASLSAMQRRLERQVISADTLLARLSSPLGPEFVAEKVVEAFEAGHQARAEAVFTLAEIALAVGRVDWAHVLEHVDHAQGIASVDEVLARLDTLLARIGDAPTNLYSYARQAIKEARKCVTF